MGLLNLSMMSKVAQHRKIVLDAATAPMAPAPTICCSTEHQSSYFNQVGRNQIARFEDEILLDNSNQ
jgi:hypothetical protein